jgi:hypothetical protein
MTKEKKAPKKKALKKEAKEKKEGPAAPSPPPLTVPTKTPIAPESKSQELTKDQQRVRDRDAYIAQLTQGSYTFNPPSPIKVARPIIVSLWIDPVAEPMALAEELKRELQKMEPDLTHRTEPGRMKWSPRMRAELTGEDFDITPAEGKDFDGTKTLSDTLRTTWAWDLKAKRPGKSLLLHLIVSAVLPESLGEPRVIVELNRPIHVDVTWWRLLDTYWEKYWKWLLGGLASAFFTIIGWRFKNRWTKG